MDERSRLVFLAVLAHVCRGEKGVGRLVRERPEIVLRTNWGVVFHRVGTVVNGVTNFKHSFGIHVPVLSREDFRSVPCVTEIELNGYCRGMNAMIGATNKLIGKEYELIQGDIDQAVAHVGELPSTARGRRRRSTRHEDSYYCSADYVESHTGFLAKIGKFFNTDIGGQPNWDDIKKVDTNICQLVAQIGRNEDGIKAAQKAFSSVSHAFEQRDDALGTAAYQASMVVNATTTKLREVVSRDTSTVKRLRERLEAEEVAQRRYFVLYSDLAAYERAALLHVERGKEFVRGVARLAQGYLSPELVSVQHVVELVNHVRRVLIPAYSAINLQMTFSSPVAVYHMKSVVYTSVVVGGQRILVASIDVPLTAGRGPMDVYRVDQTHLGVAQGHPATTRIDNLPAFVAVSYDGASTTEITTGQYSSCRGETVKTCSGLEGLTKIASDKSCASALFVDDVAKIIANCKVSFEPKPIPSRVVTLSRGNYLVHMDNWEDQRWTIQCQDNANENKNIAACNTCVIRLGCGCSLDGRDFIIPRRLSGCDISEGEEPVYKTYPVNLNLLKYVYDYDALGTVGGARTTDSFTAANEEVVISKLRSLNISDSTWGETVNTLARYDTDLNRMMEAGDRDIALFQSKADYVYAISQDVDDVYRAQTNDLVGKLGGKDVPSLFGEGSVEGSLLGYWFVAVASLAFTLFLLCRRRS